MAFSASILPPYLRRSKTIDELIPWLYLKGISTGDFQEALQSLLGSDAKSLGPNVVVRLKEQWGSEYDEWSRRDLSDNPCPSAGTVDSAAVTIGTVLMARWATPCSLTIRPGNVAAGHRRHAFPVQFSTALCIALHWHEARLIITT